MSKILFLITFSTICFFNSSAQNVSIGPILGLNYSGRTNASEAEYKAGFTGGIFLNYSTKTDFGFNGSVIYSQLGNKVKNSNAYLNLHYVQIPVNLVYYFGEGMKEGSFRPKVFLGPYVGFLIDAKIPGFTNEATLSFMNNLDYGVNLGTGFNYALKTKVWLNADIKYGLGLANVPKVASFQNRALSLSVGVSFPLGTYDKKTRKMR